MLLQQQVPAVQQHRGVHGRLARFASRGQSDAGQHRRGQVARGRGQLVHRGAAAGQKAWLFKKVGGRIAADGQLGKDRQPRAQSGGAAAGGNDLLQISGEIPDRGIDLGERDLHTSSLNAGGMQPRGNEVVL